MLISSKTKLSYLGLVLLIFFISIPCLYYVPNSLTDLSRYFSEMKLIQPNDSIRSLFRFYEDTPELSTHQNNYLYIIFQWLISKSGNLSLLPFFSIFITYMCLLIPIIHQWILNKSNIEELLFESILILSLFPYSNVCSTTRWYLSIAIFFLLTYISLNCNFNNIYILPLYIIPLFIHEGMILPIIVAFICFFSKKIHIPWYLYTVITVILMNSIYILSHYNFGLYSSIFQKYNSVDYTVYMNGSKYALISFWMVFISSFLYEILGLFIIKRNKNIKFYSEKKISILFIIIDLLLLFDLTIANRYAIFMGLSGILVYLKAKKYNGYISLKIKILFILISVLYICFNILYVILEMKFNFMRMNINGDFVSI